MSRDNTFLSIIVCTLDRSREMATCVSALAEQAKMFSDVEVIIVDNRSDDDTREVASALAAEYPGIVRYCIEEVRGLCQARNRGRAEAKGEVVAIVDDDAVPHPNWVATVREHFKAKRSDAVTGRIYARPVGGVPNWFPDNLLWILAEYDRGSSVRPITHREGIPGGHFAITTKAFDEIGGFNENLRIYSEEVEFFELFLEKGFVANYHPDIRIDHCPNISRMSRRSILNKGFNMGRGVGAVSLSRDVRSVPQKYQNAFKTAGSGFLLIMRWALNPKRFDRAFTALMNFGKSYQLLVGERSDAR